MSHKAQDELLAALRQVFTMDSFADGMAGTMGGTSAITVFYPLNIIRTKMQADDSKQAPGMLQVCQDIINEDGFMGMFTGWWGQVVALGVSNFVYFYCYNMLKVIIQKKTKMTITPLTNLAVGAVAGVINVLLTTPLWMVSTQLALQAKNDKAMDGEKPYAGIWDGLVQCFKAEGIEGLWKGFGPNLVLVSNPTIHFFTYERIRIWMSKIAHARGSKISSSEFFLMGALAKAIATVVTYPIQIVQTQLRNDRKNGEGKRKYTGAMDCFFKILQARGMEGLFRGMMAKLYQTVLTAAFQFMTYEQMRVLVFKALTGKELKGFKPSH
jgi:adenine nucleotide transporter 17